MATTHTTGEEMRWAAYALWKAAEANRAVRNGGRSNRAKGPAKKKIGDPRGGWVGQSTKKGWGQICFFDIFLIVFLNSRHRETPKNVIKKNRKKSVLDFWSNFL
jgi:hypothetical protein